MPATGKSVGSHRPFREKIPCLRQHPAFTNWVGTTIGFGSCEVLYKGCCDWLMRHWSIYGSVHLHIRYCLTIAMCVLGSPHGFRKQGSVHLSELVLVERLQVYSRLMLMYTTSMIMAPVGNTHNQSYNRSLRLLPKWYSRSIPKNLNESFLVALKRALLGLNSSDRLNFHNWGGYGLYLL